MRKLVLDTENDNLLRKVSKFHCGGAIDLQTGEEFWFKSHELKDMLNLFDSYDVNIGHSAANYDIPALKKITNYTWKPKAKIQCTKTMSQVLNFSRFGFGHSLEKWGDFFGYEKIKYTGGFEAYNEDMFAYMKRDVRLNVMVYNYLYKELVAYIKKSGNQGIIRAIEIETEIDRIMAEETEAGWKFDTVEARKLFSVIDKNTKEIEDAVNPLLGYSVKAVDGSTRNMNAAIAQLKKEGVSPVDWPEIPPKKPQYKKDGTLFSTTCDWFQLDHATTVDESPVLGSYTRIEFVVNDIGNTDTVKDYITKLGWKPDEWNYKRINGRLVKTSAKLSESSLERLGGKLGKYLNDYYTLRSRRSILEGWFEHVDENDRIHGDVFNIGTPTFRQSHNVIANLPSVKAVLGKEVRSLFISEKGKVLVSADSAGCQLRLLAHYMQDKDFTELLLNSDMHQRIANILQCERDQAKRFIFAFLFGAGAAKLGGYIGKTTKETQAGIDRLKSEIPALKTLIERVKSVVSSKGFIYGLDFRPVMLAKDQTHKALNYLIQSAEAIVMKATVLMIDQELTKAGIEFKHILFYHDEHTVEVNEQDAERTKEIIMKCFEEAPKEFGVNIMVCGDCNIGKNYYEVH